MRRIFNYINTIHSCFSYTTIPVGAVYSVSMNTDKLDKNTVNDTNIITSVVSGMIFVLPEAVVGGVAGYFFMYTVPVLSAYKRYMYSKAN